MRWAKVANDKGEARLLNLTGIAAVVDREDGGQDIMQVRDGRLVALCAGAPGNRLVDSVPGFVAGRFWTVRFEGGPVDHAWSGLVNAEALVEVADRGKARYLVFVGGFVAWTDIPVKDFEGAINVGAGWGRG